MLTIDIPLVLGSLLVDTPSPRFLFPELDAAPPPRWPLRHAEETSGSATDAVCMPCPTTQRRRRMGCNPPTEDTGELLHHDTLESETRSTLSTSQSQVCPRQMSLRSMWHRSMQLTTASPSRQRQLFVLLAIVPHCQGLAQA